MTEIVPRSRRKRKTASIIKHVKSQKSVSDVVTISASSGRQTTIKTIRLAIYWGCGQKIVAVTLPRHPTRFVLSLCRIKYSNVSQTSLRCSRALVFIEIASPWVVPQRTQSSRAPISYLICYHKIRETTASRSFQTRIICALLLPLPRVFIGRMNDSRKTWKSCHRRTAKNLLVEPFKKFILLPHPFSCRVAFLFDLVAS